MPDQGVRGDDASPPCRAGVESSAHTHARAETVEITLGAALAREGRERVLKIRVDETVVEPEEERDSPRVSETAAAPDLNGRFLTCADPEETVLERVVASRLHRQDQLRASRERVVFQSSSPFPEPFGQAPVENEVILDASNLLPFDFLRTGDRIGRAVLKLQRSDGAVGTAFLVAPEILLTNHHVLPAPATAATAYVLANFERSLPDDASGRPAFVPLDPQTLFVTNADLDFTFCAVRGLEFLGSVPLDRNSLNVLKSEHVNIVQHPRGRPKEIGLQDNQVVKADKVVVQYSCGTEPGSSGSPVFNNQWKLVALHHAAIATEGPDGRKAAAYSQARYLNEGIRLSAIAIWLETLEPTAREQRAHVARLRSIFGGLDPQIGFFGALGRKARGRSAAEIVIDCYRSDADDLDIAFWNLGSLGGLFRDRLGDLARVVADMRMDVWCLLHADAESVRALCAHLQTHFQLDHGYLIERDETLQTFAVIYRRSKGLVVEHRPWSESAPESVRDLIRLLIQARNRRGEPIDIHLVPIPWMAAADDVHTRSIAMRPMIEAIGREIKSGQAHGDWLLVGDPTTLLALDTLQEVAGGEHELMVASDENDGTASLLVGPTSQVERVFLSPNLSPVFDPPGSLVASRDRDLPLGVRGLCEHQPIALRLSFNGPRKPRPLNPSKLGKPPWPTSPPPASTADDHALEERLKALLRPLLTEILGEMRQNDAGEAPATL